MFRIRKPSPAAVLPAAAVPPSPDSPTLDEAVATAPATTAAVDAAPAAAIGASANTADAMAALASDAGDAVIARQAILNAAREVYGYELFDRSTGVAAHTAASDAALLFNAPGGVALA